MILKKKSLFTAFWLLLLFVVIFLYMSSSSCYAYSLDDFINFSQQIQNYSGATSQQKKCAQWVVNYQNNIRGYINSSCDSFVVWGGNTTQFGDYYVICGYEGGTFQGWGAREQIYIIENYNIRTGKRMITRGGNSWNNIDGAYIGFQFCLLNEQMAQNVNFTGYIGNNIYNEFYPPIDYLVFNNNYVNNSAYNGSLFTYYYQGDFYSNLNLLIGTIDPKDSYYYEVRFLDNATNIVLGTCFVALNLDPIDIYNGDGCLYIDNEQNVYVITRYLNYNKQYRIDIVSYYGDGGDNLQEDDDWIIFLPQNASVSGDVIVSFGSGDFTQQDSTNQIIDNQEQSTNDIIGSLTNFTPINSGDILGNIGIIQPYSSGDSIDNFFVDILENISEVFLLDDEVTLHITLPIFRHDLYVRSDFWITRNYLGDLADFIESAWWILICMGIIYKIDVLVELFNFGDFINASYQLYQTRRLL